jgi:hypothetical protein
MKKVLKKFALILECSAQQTGVPGHYLGWSLQASGNQITLLCPRPRRGSVPAPPDAGPAPKHFGVILTPLPQTSVKQLFPSPVKQLPSLTITQFNISTSSRAAGFRYTNLYDFASPFLLS